MPLVPAVEELCVMCVITLIQDLQSAEVTLCQCGDDVMCI